MRHLILTLDFPPLRSGGVARSMDETARGLVAIGESVRILTKGRGAEARAHDAAYPAEVTRMGGRHWRRFHPLWLRWHLPRIGRSEPGAVVHTATWETAPSVQRYAARFGWKVAIHAQGREVARTFHAPREQEQIRRALAAADAVLPISRHVADRVMKAGADPARVAVIPPCVDVRRIQGGDGARFRARFGLEGKRVILTLGRLIDRKGQDTLIRALPSINRRVRDTVYVLVGTGSYREELEGLARREGVADQVVFAGFLPDEELPDAYAAADVYVMVSREGREAGDIEGFGITYLEAAAAGVPIVAGRSGGVEDAVGDATLVDPEDPDAVAEAIVGILRDPVRAKETAEAGRKRVEREFTPESRARRILARLRP